MLPAPLNISAEMARRFHRRVLLLDAPVPDIATALAHHGYVQIDPINVCGRMQDHILRNRVTGYREGGLMYHIHGDAPGLTAEQRAAFEHHLPDTNVLVAFPLDAWPHLLAAMHRRTRRRGAWSGKLTAREEKLAEQILTEIAGRGPLSSEHIDDDRRSRQMVWGSFSLAKTTLQKLFFHGRVLIARRESNRRLYDLPERVLPARVLAMSEPDRGDTARWLAVLKLRQRRLVTLKRAELPLVEDLVQPVVVADCPILYCLRDDVSLLESFSTLESQPTPARLNPLLLAPLDPLIYDRRVTARLWGFDYTWEVYTPPARRKRGYYALPVLAGTEIVGHIDPKADRTNRKLTVVSGRVRRGHAVADAVKQLAAFLDLCG
ncbi:MAG: winged helix-turn-helix domain-containing protein [Opitutus sp.]|nr:winged helix-turn-helix domain-containing protein [Opitutus sp.]